MRRFHSLNTGWRHIDGPLQTQQDRPPPAQRIQTVLAEGSGIASGLGLFFVWPVPLLLGQRWLVPQAIAYAWLGLLILTVTALVAATVWPTIRWGRLRRFVDVCFLLATLLPPGVLFFVFIVCETILKVRVLEWR